MKILITGSNGLLGQKLVSALSSDQEVELIATSRGSNQCPEHSGYTFDQMDIANRDQVFKILEKYKPDCVINTAAMTHVDQCQKEKDACWKINVGGVANLIEACKKTDSHLVHLSTDFIFDGLAGPYREEDPPNPVSHYGDSKLESEKILQASDIHWTIIRTILVFGVVRNLSRSNFVLWAKGALEKGEPFKVVTDQYRAPTLAEDLAAGCIAAAKKMKAGIYHVGGKDGGTIFELVETVADFFKLDKTPMTPSTSDALKAPAKRPVKTGFVLDKAIRELDYKPHSFKEGLGLVQEQLAQLA